MTEKELALKFRVSPSNSIVFLAPLNKRRASGKYRGGGQLHVLGPLNYAHLNDPGSTYGTQETANAYDL